jgi:hypothetical protein
VKLGAEPVFPPPERPMANASDHSLCSCPKSAVADFVEKARNTDPAPPSPAVLWRLKDFTLRQQGMAVPETVNFNLSFSMAR